MLHWDPITQIYLTTYQLSRRSLHFAFPSKTRASQCWKPSSFQKFNKKNHSFEITNENMSNIPKSIKDELQDFIELLFPSVSWLRTHVKEEKIVMISIFIIKVTFFGHKTQGFFFCYLSNIKSKWNKLKWKYWIIQIMIICMMVVIFHMRM